MTRNICKDTAYPMHEQIDRISSYSMWGGAEKPVYVEDAKYCSGRAQTGISCHDDRVYVHTSLGKINVNDHDKDLSVSQNAQFWEYSQFASNSVLGMVWKMFFRCFTM